jgi:hypothetical protein
MKGFAAIDRHREMAFPVPMGRVATVHSEMDAVAGRFEATCRQIVSTSEAFLRQRAPMTKWHLLTKPRRPPLATP